MSHEAVTSSRPGAARRRRDRDRRAVAAGGKGHDAGEIVSLHDSAAWVALNVLPAMVTEPEREADPVLAVAATVTVPGPEPLAPAVTVSQELLLVAFQPQAPGAVTEMSVLSPAVANAFEVGEMCRCRKCPPV